MCMWSPEIPSVPGNLLVTWLENARYAKLTYMTSSWSYSLPERGRTKNNTTTCTCIATTNYSTECTTVSYTELDIANCQLQLLIDGKDYPACFTLALQLIGTSMQVSSCDVERVFSQLKLNHDTCGDNMIMEDVTEGRMFARCNGNLDALWPWAFDKE